MARREDPPRWPTLAELAREVGAVLQRSGQTVAVAESSAGGLIAAALLSVPGASAYFRGGAVVYTVDAKERLLNRSRESISQPRAATEAHALVLAEAVRERLSADWGIGETGATGPTGNRYGDPPGHCCVGIAGPYGIARAQAIATGAASREQNMFAFAAAALRLLADALSSGA